MKKIHSLIVEGILFCGSGLGLLSYSLISYGKAFNKNWSQSPYLFPLLVGLALTGLSVWLIGEGIQESRNRKEKEEAKEKAKEKAELAGTVQTKSKSVQQYGWVLAALILCAAYYLALSWLKVPYVTIGILSFRYTFSTFEVATVVFLVAMMAFMGVRRPAVLVFVPLGTSLFLSIAFRTLLHVLLP